MASVDLAMTDARMRGIEAHQTRCAMMVQERERERKERCEAAERVAAKFAALAERDGEFLGWYQEAREAGQIAAHVYAVSEGRLIRVDVTITDETL